MKRMPAFDPRTVARDIPGIFDAIFPQLTPGVVAHFNRTAVCLQDEVVPLSMVQESALQKAMLFELGFAAGEKLLSGQEIDWADCLQIAIDRQRRHFDARIPNEITKVDRQVADMVGRNMAAMVCRLAKERGYPAVPHPGIPGFQWIASGFGDFSIGRALIEVKCSNRNFSASDYRQIVMYWLLSFAASVEGNGAEWSEGVLMNPRSGNVVVLEFDEFLHVISAGRTKVEILLLFSSMVGIRDIK